MIDMPIIRLKTLFYSSRITLDDCKICNLSIIATILWLSQLPNIAMMFQFQLLMLYWLLVVMFLLLLPTVLDLMLTLLINTYEVVGWYQEVFKRKWHDVISYPLLIKDFQNWAFRCDSSVFQQVEIYGCLTSWLMIYMFSIPALPCLSQDQQTTHNIIFVVDVSPMIIFM